MDINFRKTAFITIASKLSQAPDLGLPEFTIAGRSNAGKSSFVNALGDNKNLARISSKPGKTRNIAFFNVDDKLLISDLPGYGFSMANKGEIKRYSDFTDSYLTSNRKISGLIHCMDIRHDPSQDDIMMTEWALHNEISYLVVLTKADKLKPSKRASRVHYFKKFLNLGQADYIFTLAHKEGIDNIRSKLSALVTDLD